jgi:Holliday junction resolvase
MAMTPEGKVKKKIVEQLKALGCYYFFPATGGYGKSGVPDIVGCYKGKFFGIECKAGKNTPTALQEKNLSDIALAGGVAAVVNEANMNDIKALLILDRNGRSVPPVGLDMYEYK